MTLAIDRPPAEYALWPEYAKCRYRERMAILREGNNIPDNQPLPYVLHLIAIQQAENEIRIAIEDDLKGTL
jgi:hypothetical protein